MQRENFYILLDLSLKPPETDPAKIEQAIKKKQSEWSRMRNHPSKGIQAQHYIGMITEIRKVMLNSELREKEAEEARKILLEKKKEKYSGIDRHLDIRMSKGFITDEEIKKLAKLHRINEEDIRKRLQKKEEKKYAGIDKHIRIRMKKGYITENEIYKISKIHNIDEEVVRRRIRGPIKKEGTAKVTVKPLDRSIEKVIRDNLKIVGKSSLYNFLGLSPEAGLEKLQQKSKEKEAEILKIRKKNAVASASGVLVGHCMSVFKNEQSRAAYDSTLTRARFSELNSDIDVAGLDGIIRAEYFDILVKRAIDLGMDPDEATDHIRKYCKKKNWAIEKESKPKKKKTKNSKLAVYVALLLLTIIFAGGFYGRQWLKEQQSETDYQNLIAQAETLDSPEEKIKIYKDYLDSHTGNKYSGRIWKQIGKAKAEIHEKEFQQVLKTAESFLEKEDLDSALAAYKRYIDQNPKSAFAGMTRKKAEAISELIEDKDYRKLDRIQGQSLNQRIAAYYDYLNKHPAGKNRKKIISLLADLSDAYYITLKDELQKIEKQNAYEKCMEVTERFIRIYPQDRRSNEFKDIQEKCREKRLERMVLAELRKRALEQKNDFDAAKQIYLNYLKLNPDSPINPAVRQDLIQLEKERKAESLNAEMQRRIALIDASAGRFVLESNEIVTDTRTGLMWTLWDSKNSQPDCMDHEAAENYAKNLNTGDYEDWRLPTAGELCGIYDSEPSFPIGESPWYWTSESYKSYHDGWVRMVKAVMPRDKENSGIERKDSRECGGVRAVRP